MATLKLNNMIFSNTKPKGFTCLLDEVEKVLGGIDSCIATSENMNSFKLNSDIQEGLNCLKAMSNKIELELTSGKTFRP